MPTGSISNIGNLYFWTKKKEGVSKVSVVCNRTGWLFSFSLSSIVFTSECSNLFIRYCPYCRESHEFDYSGVVERVYSTPSSLLHEPFHVMNSFEIDEFFSMSLTLRYDRLPFREPYKLYGEAKELIEECTDDSLYQARVKLERVVKLFKNMESPRDLAYSRVLLAELVFNHFDDKETYRGEVELALADMTPKDEDLIERAREYLSKTSPDYERFISTSK